MCVSVRANVCVHCINYALIPFVSYKGGGLLYLFEGPTSLVCSSPATIAITDALACLSTHHISMMSLRRASKHVYSLTFLVSALDQNCWLVWSVEVGLPNSF